MSLDDRIKNALAEGRLDQLFLGELGWDRPRLAPFMVDHAGSSYTVNPVAQKSGLHVFDIESLAEVPPAATQAAIDREIAKRSPERLLVFRSRITQIWRWPETRPSGGTRLVPHEYRLGSPNENLVQRIARLAFAPEEQEGLTLADVRARVRLSLSAEAVTKRFYDAFRRQHSDLLEGIEGIDDEADRSWYASLLMNRLMFVYFMQMKGFIGGDRDFLRSCLRAIRGTRGADAFYDFYRDLLVPLFHDGLGSSRHDYGDAEIERLLRDVPYINGGLFESHRIERAYTIQIRDEYFERIFGFFDGFTWHLDTSPTGDPNEINPDVLGYVFEQYINLTTSGKRDKGAYYTKEDVTGYMVSIALIPHLIDRLISSTGTNPFIHLVADPDRYIRESLLHGWDATEGTWVEVPSGIRALWDDVMGWAALDESPTDEAAVLPGETWVEALDRRARVDGLRSAIRSGTIASVDELITGNLDGRTLLIDAVRALSAPHDLLAFWDELSTTSILDPTCGSGAFLFAALDVLDDTYGAILETAELHVRSGSPQARDVLQRLTEAQRPHQNVEYFRLKHAALSNLFGVDLMPEAVEIAKLRLFLTLVARLESPDEIEPLPDLDFNLRTGNLLVGFRDLDDARLRVACDLIAESAIERLIPQAQALVDGRDAFIAAIEATADSNELARLKVALEDGTEALRVRADEIYFEAEGNSREAPGAGERLSKWREHSSPFHWFIEFPHIARRGGFDVVIGNPPYIATPANADLGYSRLGYVTRDAPDLYAVCVERAESLRRAPSGRFAMIVPLSAAFSADFGSLREALRDSSGSIWWSTYSRLPDGLFAGNARIRNTIVGTHGPSEGERREFATRHHVWATAFRPYLFSTVEYDELRCGGAGAPARAGRALRVVSRTASLARRPLSGGAKVLCRPTGQYWTPVLPGPVPQLDADGTPCGPDERVKTFASVELGDLALAVSICASNVGYAWWSAYGDDFDFTQEIVAGYLERVLPEVRGDAELRSLAATVLDQVWDSGFYTLNAGKGYVNIRYPNMRGLLAEFDRVLLRSLGLDDDAFRDLQVWYRQVMRGWEPGPKSRPLSPELVADLRGGRSDW